MLRPSFVPPPQIRLLRDLTRYRLDLVNVRTAEKNRVEKLLEDAQIKLSVVASDIFGVSGREMMARLIAGERDPKALAQLARASMRRKIVLLEEAFVGRFTDHHAFLLRTMLARIDETSADIAAIETRIEELIAPFAQTVARLDEITGVGATAAHTMIAEIGLDMSRFPTAAHLCSWARFAPGVKQSAGKSKGRGSTGHGNPYLARVLGEAAVGASRTDTFLGERYRRIARRVLRPVSGQLCETTSGGLVDLISVSCCLSAAGIGFLGILSRRWSWSIVTSGLPPPVPVWRTPTGFPCSACMRHGWAWVPPVSRGRWCPHGRAQSFAATRRLTTAVPVTPVPQAVPGCAINEASARVHWYSPRAQPTPSLPLACGPRTERGPLGFPVSFAPDRYWPQQSRTSRWGQVSDTDPDYVFSIG